MNIHFAQKLSALFIVMIWSLIGSSQTPQGFNYQAAVYDGSGNPIINKLVGLKITLLKLNSILKLILLPQMGRV